MEIESRLPLSLGKFSGGRSVLESSRVGETKGSHLPGTSWGIQNCISGAHPRGGSILSHSYSKCPRERGGVPTDVRQPFCNPLKHSRLLHGAAWRGVMPGLSSNCSLCVLRHVCMPTALWLKLGSSLIKGRLKQQESIALLSQNGQDFKKKIVLASVWWDRRAALVLVGVWWVNGYPKP